MKKINWTEAMCTASWCLPLDEILSKNVEDTVRVKFFNYFFYDIYIIYFGNDEAVQEQKVAFPVSRGPAKSFRSGASPRARCNTIYRRSLGPATSLHHDAWREWRRQKVM